MNLKKAAILIFSLTPGLSQSADVNWWHTSSPHASSGQITLKNSAGTTTNVNTNPTGATLLTRSTNTQAPTVIVQATASLPIKTVGDACTSSTSGSAPNQTADENHAITLDRTSLLTCQSGTWKPQVNSLSQPLVVCTLGGVSFANYLYSTFATLRDNGGGLHNYTGYTGAMNIALNTSANFSPPFSITLTTVTKYICNADGFLISSSVTPVTVVSAINEGSGVVIRLTW